MGTYTSIGGNIVFSQSEEFKTLVDVLQDGGWLKELPWERNKLFWADEDDSVYDQNYFVDLSTSVIKFPGLSMRNIHRVLRDIPYSSALDYHIRTICTDGCCELNEIKAHQTEIWIDDSEAIKEFLEFKFEPYDEDDLDQNAEDEEEEFRCAMDSWISSVV